MADGIVQVAADGPGKKVDTSELTRADGNVVERQRVTLGDANDPLALLKVAADGTLALDLGPMLIEAKRHTALLTAIALALGADVADHLLQD